MSEQPPQSADNLPDGAALDAEIEDALQRISHQPVEVREFYRTLHRVAALFLAVGQDARAIVDGQPVEARMRWLSHAVGREVRTIAEQYERQLYWLKGEVSGEDIPFIIAKVRAFGFADQARLLDEAYTSAVQLVGLELFRPARRAEALRQFPESAPADLLVFARILGCVRDALLVAWEPSAPAPSRKKKGGGGAPKRRGPKPDEQQAKTNKAIFDAWKTGQYPTYEALARELHKKEREVRLAIDSGRKRQKRMPVN